MKLPQINLSKDKKMSNKLVWVPINVIFFINVSDHSIVGTLQFYERGYQKLL